MAQKGYCQKHLCYSTVMMADMRGMMMMMMTMTDVRPCCKGLLSKYEPISDASQVPVDSSLMINFPILVIKQNLNINIFFKQNIVFLSDIMIASTDRAIFIQIMFSRVCEYFSFPNVPNHCISR